MLIVRHTAHGITGVHRLVRTYTLTHSHTHTQPHAVMHKHHHPRSRTLAAFTLTMLLTATHTQSRTVRQLHSHTVTMSHCQVVTLSHFHIHTHTVTEGHIHTHTHSHTHTLAHTHTLTHIRKRAKDNARGGWQASGWREEGRRDDHQNRRASQLRDGARNREALSHCKALLLRPFANTFLPGLVVLQVCLKQQPSSDMQFSTGQRRAPAVSSCHPRQHWTR